MDSKFVLRSGKHAGKTVGWLQDNEPSYLVWIEENRPEMLREKSAAKPKAAPKPNITQLDENSKSLQPNYNFYNEGPDPMSLPYLRKMAEQKANSGETKSFFDLDI